ncbi:MAG: hypothetical protein AMXMBFR64_30660 [Myxococcales bacterium]
MTIPEQYRAEFEAEVRQRTAKAIWVVGLIALILYPPTILMDWVSYPEHLGDLALVRFGATAAIAVFVALLWTLRQRGLDARFARATVWLFIVVIATSLDLMSLVVGGPETPYYAGITLLLLAILVSMPWGLGEMGLATGFIVIQYDVAMLIWDPVFDMRGFFIANYFYFATIFIGLFWCAAGDQLRRVEFLGRKRIEEERSRSDRLLLNILPAEVADELKEHGKVEARTIGSCAILFTDFVGFTRLAGRAEPDELVRVLDAAFSRFDGIVTKWEIEKLKTIGDAYMCAGGVLGRQPDHLVRSVLAGLEMLHALESADLRSVDGTPWRMRIGIHTGPVVAGIIGRKKFTYDLWGDTVNTASRLESTALPNSINVATSVYKQVERFFVGIDRGWVPVRGKGAMAMTRIVRLRPEFSADAAGHAPNARLFEALPAWIEAQAELPLALPRPAPKARASMEKDGLDPLHLLAQLTEEDRELILRAAEPIRFEAGQVLIEQGQSLSVLFLVLEGTLAVRIAREQVAIDVGLLGPGDIAGELSFVSWEPASATVAAVEPGAALRIDFDWMQAFGANHPETGVRFFQSLALVLAQRVRQANARLFLQSDAGARTVGDPEPPSDAVMERVGVFQARLIEAASLPPARVDATVSEACDALVEVLDEPGAGPALRRETSSFLLRSALMERLWARPALDLDAAAHILRGEPRGHGAVGAAVDRWVLSRPSIAAVREVFVACGQQIVRARPRPGEPLRVTVLGAAGAPMMLDVLPQMDGAAITCVDHDVSALAAIGQRGRTARLSLVCSDVLRTAESSNPMRLVPQDLFVLPHLASPVDEGILMRVLEDAWAGLAPGGALVLGAPAAPETSLVDAVLGRSLGGVRATEVLQLAAATPFRDSPAEQMVLDGGLGTVVVLRRG